MERGCLGEGFSLTWGLGGLTGRFLSSSNLILFLSGLLAVLRFAEEYWLFEYFLE